MLCVTLSAYVPALLPRPAAEQVVGTGHCSRALLLFCAYIGVTRGSVDVFFAMQMRTFRMSRVVSE